jgi:hypothetical protein
MQLPNKISVLLLADNSLGDEGVIELLNVLMDKETLVELDVSLNHFEEATAEVIGQFIGTNKVIYRLNISKNIIGDNGAQLISSRLEQNGSLASLDLSSCRIADPGAIGIARALRRNTALTTLRISDNFLTRECGYVMVENIRHNEHIQKIDVSATQIDHFVIQALVALCKRNRQIEKEIGLQPLKKEVIQLSIQRTKMPEAESRLAVLEEHRNELEEEVGSLDEDLDNTQNTATANILQSRKQIQTAEEGIVEEQEQIVKIEADNEKMVQEFEERYQEIVGTQEKERQLIKRYDEQALEIDALIQHNVDATTAEAGELQSQIDQIRELLSRTTEVSFDPEALRIYEKPELPEFMLVPKSNLFLNDDIMDLREQEKKKRKKKGRKKSPKGKKKKSSPSLPQLEPTAEGVESTPPPPEPVLAAPAPASQSPGGKRGESARRISPLKKGKL